MLADRIQDETYHANGKLSYRSVRAKIASGFEHLYESARLHPDGYSWVYQGKAEKWFNNGERQWTLEYDKFGNVIGGKDYTKLT